MLELGYKSKFHKFLVAGRLNERVLSLKIQEANFGIIIKVFIVEKRKPSKSTPTKFFEPLLLPTYYPLKLPHFKKIFYKVPMYEFQTNIQIF